MKKTVDTRHDTYYMEDGSRLELDAYAYQSDDQYWATVDIIIVRGEYDYTMKRGTKKFASMSDAIAHAKQKLGINY